MRIPKNETMEIEPDKKGKLKKIIFEYENMTQILEGEDVTAWKDDVDGVCMLAHVHGQNPDWTKHKWKIQNNS